MAKLEKLDRNVDKIKGYHVGYGEIINEEYKCPCGKGTVVYEDDDLIGYKSKYIYCNCSECNEKYNFGRGTATKK